MLESESQMYAGFCPAGEGEYWSIRLNQRVKDGVQLRGCSNFNFPLNEGLLNIYFKHFLCRPVSFCDLQPSLISRDARITLSSTC